MFYRAALDINEKNGPPNKRFMSCVRFVADIATPAVFYLNSEWAKRDTLGEFGIDVKRLSNAQKRILEEADLYPDASKPLEMPALVYLREGAWEQSPDPDTGAMSGLTVPKREFVLSSSEVVHQAYLRDHGLNAQTAVLCLAAVGLDIMLPNVAFDLFADDEIERIKETLQEERHSYLEVVSKLAEQSYEGLKDGQYEDVLRWAESEAAFKLAPKARMLQESVSSMASRQLRRAGYSFWRDGVPAIGAAYIGGGIVPASTVSAQAALRTLVQAISSARAEGLVPEVTYAMNISKSLEQEESQ